MLLPADRSRFEGRVIRGSGDPSAVAKAQKAAGISVPAIDKYRVNFLNNFEFGRTRAQKLAGRSSVDVFGLTPKGVSK